MTVQCQKCGKDYQPKRRGGKFCSTSCRVVQHQLVKKGEAWPSPATGNERYLADKLTAVGRSAQETLAKVKSLPAEAGLAELRTLVRAWAGVADNSIIERIQYNDQQEMKALVTRLKRRRSTTSVSVKR